MFKYLPATGRMYITDPTVAGSPIIFDTDDGLLCVHPDDVKIGSFVLPARSASSTGINGSRTDVDVNTNHLIGSVKNGATVVRGMLRTVWASGPNPLDSLWRSASGSHLDFMAAVGYSISPQTGTGNFFVAGMGFYTFLVSGGSLYLNERLVIRAQDPGGPPAIYQTRPQCTVHYRLLVGSFV